MKKAWQCPQKDKKKQKRVKQGNKNAVSTITLGKYGLAMTSSCIIRGNECK